MSLCSPKETSANDGKRHQKDSKEIQLLGLIPLLIATNVEDILNFSMPWFSHEMNRLN